MQQQNEIPEEKAEDEAEAEEDGNKGEILSESDLGSELDDELFKIEDTRGPDQRFRC